ncbi:MAG: polysaccharide deacetylase family protein, partial [Acidobacteriota bacterium]|nr:polysaccharide deacetylase family protein [Acidobacteriota bacterium]
MSEHSNQPISEVSAGEPDRRPLELRELLQRCYRYAFSLTHDRGRAEDLVQDACLAVVRICGPWTRPLLFSIIHNRFVDQFRRSKRIGMEPLDEAGAEPPDVDDRFWSSPIAAPMPGEDLDRALARLRPEEREARIDELLERLGVEDPRQATGLMLDWDEVREMAAQGISFGSHTATHPILSRLTRDEARAEIVESKRTIEEQLGIPVRSFAYPNGKRRDFNEETKQL